MSPPSSAPDASSHPAGPSAEVPAAGAAQAAEDAAARHRDGATRVLRRFRIVFNAVKSHFQQVERLAGIGGAQLWALSVIAGQPDIGVGRLAAAMDVHQTTASNLVKSLMKAGLIDSQRDDVDRRTVRLRVLAPGLEVLSRAPGPFTGVLPQALASLDAATLQRLDEDLARLIQALRADPQAAKTPLASM